jgi:cytochrome d ubiquinol oxidase subunit I
VGALTIARWQFGITTVYHFLFVPLTIGLALIVAVLETFYLRSRDPRYLRATRFWGKFLVLNFAVGVVTGLVLEFQFGMNWSAYSRFVGDVFGGPLAVEGLLAFFLESTFLGLWIFGWDRLSPRLHLLAAWMVALGTIVSAFWILTANSWMQNPVGYRIDPATGHAQLDSFAAVISNRVVWTHLVHTVFSAIVTAAALVLAVSAWHLLRNSREAAFPTTAAIAAVAIALSGFGVALSGHFQGVQMTGVQPMKMAAAEALWETEKPAAFSVVALPDSSDGRNLIDIRVPRLLSLLATSTFGGEVKGINPLQAEYEARYGAGDYRPPVWLIYWSFRLMVGAGLLLIVLGGAGAWLARKGKLARARWFHRLAMASVALPLLANTTGWIVTEIGRQPWTVFGLMLTRDAVSPSVGPVAVAISLSLFTVTYAALAAVDVTLMLRLAKAGIEEQPGVDQPDAAAAY